MVNPSFGNEHVFQSSNTLYISVASLDNTHFVVAYRDASGYSTAIIGEISSGVVTYGTPSVFNTTTSTNEIVVTALDSTHFVVSYNYSNAGKSRVGVVSGTTITSYGAVASCGTWGTIHMAAATLDSTHFVVAYSNLGASQRGNIIVGAVSGTTITFGSRATTQDYSTNTSLATLDSTHFILTHNNYARVGTVTGTAISLGTNSTFHTGGNSLNQITVLDSTHFVIAFRDAGNSNYGTAIAGLVSGTSISSYGTKSVFNSADSSYLCITSIDDKYFAVGYKDVGNSNYGTLCIGDVIGTSIDSYGKEVVFNSGETDYIDISLLINPNFVVAYRDVANSHYGTSLCGKAIFFVPQINII